MNTNIKTTLLMIFWGFASIGIVALLSPLVSALTNWLVSLTWYQAGVMFLAIGAAGVVVVMKQL